MSLRIETESGSSHSQVSRRLERLIASGQPAAMKIELRHVSKSYGRVHALDAAALDIAPGQFISQLLWTLRTRRLGGRMAITA